MERSARVFDCSLLAIGDIVTRICAGCDEPNEFVVEVIRADDGFYSGVSVHLPCGVRLQMLDTDYPPWPTYSTEGL